MVCVFLRSGCLFACESEDYANELVHEAGVSFGPGRSNLCRGGDIGRSDLDVAYRVLSLIGLGLLLLAGAFAYQSLKPRRPAAAGEAPDQPTGEVSAP
jgi:hypothetical protein